ncbi:macrolide family glycosyltransferase [Crossiella sp. CA198]|uniref:macrolide family glycosyltransferase n=1 Tax=Crossiella sp. CA198 TaxID=3455607 RepID=UPI003F8D0C70
MRNHIAFLAGPASGHINPTLPLVEELLARGHQVSYATGEAFVPAVSAAGARPLPLPWVLPRPVVSKGGQTTEDLARTLLGFIEQSRTVLPVLEQALTANRPDVLCYDMMTTFGALIATKLGLAQATTVPNFASSETFSLQALLAPRDFDPGHPVFRQYIAARRELTIDFGLAPEQFDSAFAIAPLNLVFLPREFQLAGDTFDDRFHFIGPSLGRRAHSTDWRPPADGSPVLFVSLGTAFNDRPDFFTLCANAFAGTAWQVAMAIGETDPARLGAIPPNFEVRPYFPQPTVLAHAAAFLTHAGMNSTMEAAHYQVPLVAFPQTPEQALNARRAQELGFCRLLDAGQLDSDLLRQTVAEVAADQGVRASLAAMAKHLHAAGGAAAGADALEAYLR